MIVESGSNRIYIDGIELVSHLRNHFLSEGRDIMREANVSGNNVMCTCPFHKDGQERRPSFGISTINGVAHCLACGWSGTLPDLISALFGYEDWGKFGNSWLIKNFLSLRIATRPELIIAERKPISQAKIKRIGFTEQELQKYRWIHPYMYRRGLTDELIERFDIGYDRGTDCITFPVWDVNSNPAFIARRSVRGKYFNYPRDSNKPVYLADRFVHGEYKYAVICESFFNAYTGWRYGFPSVALMGTGTAYQYSILKQLPVRKYILALDPDEAGRRGADKLFYALRDTKIITEFKIPQGKDINDLGEKILYLPEIFKN